MPLGNEINIIQVPWMMQFQNIYIYGYGGLSPKPLEWRLAFSCTFRRETPFGNEIYLPKYPGSCSFRIYMVMGSISKTLGVVACFFLHLQEGDALWK